MRPKFLVLLLFLLLGSGAALAQIPREFLDIFGGMVQSAFIQATQAAWKKLSPSEIQCIDQTLQLRGSSLRLAIQQGIMPSDQRLTDVRSFCQAQISGQQVTTLNDNFFYYVANTTPPDPFLSLRTQPSSVGQRIKRLPNGTLLQVLQRRPDGWWFVRVVTSGEQGWALSSSGNKEWIVCCSNGQTTR